MSLKSYYLVLCSSIVLLACKEQPETTKEDSSPVNNTVVEPPKVTSKAIPKTSTYGKLQGKWQSVEDEKSFIMFEGTTRIEMYKGEEPSSSPFKLAASCNDDRASYSDVKKLYILSDDLCWSIDALNTEHLELTYMDAGNILVYKKVKTENP